FAGIPAATPLYEAEEVPGIFFKTGFVPIETADGEILGIVAVEGGSGFFTILPSLRRTWWAIGIVSALIAAVLVLLLWTVFRALSRYEQGMRGAAALATAGQLAAVVAHEIRNPLAILQSRAERVQEELLDGADPKEAAAMLDVVPVEVRRMNRILTNYLSLARLREGPGRAELLTVIRETLELVEADLSRQGIRTRLDAPGEDLRIAIDAGPLRQALLNLFLNARDAMPAGGELIVGVAREGAVVRIEVADTGTGIEKKRLGRLFEPFFTTRASGSGLGLAVVDSVVRAARGRIEVASTPGAGSRFTLRLPVEPDEDAKGEDDGA
ncbi:MAG: hypothetical protein GF346_13695, partial [Candidatus Eisenbacteria bacterium]|nr:hypothetical protein [Candidatus Latescibacterota bacterium]MBD3303494.1 hypothetical protein [Candidatus Eisenbacteria bacterium]